MKKKLVDYGFESYQVYVHEQLNKGRFLEEVIDEIFNDHKLKLKKSLGILPRETLPKEISVKNVKLSLTNTPTAGTVQMNSNEDLDVAFSCHNGYKGKKEGNNFSCSLKEDNL